MDAIVATTSTIEDNDEVRGGDDVVGVKGVIANDHALTGVTSLWWSESSCDGSKGRFS